MSIHISKMDPGEVLFERITIGGDYEPIAIDRLKNYLQKTNHPIGQVSIDSATARRFVLMRGIEKHRITRLTPEFLFQPLLFVEDIRVLSADGGVHDCWDGHHRYVRLHLEGYTTTKAWIVKPVVWRQYVVEGCRPRTASEILLGRSGL